MLTSQLKQLLLSNIYNMIKPVLILMLLPFAALSGGSRWYLNEGGLNLHGSFQFIKADHYFDNDGEIQKLQNYSYQTSTVYLDAQYGISKHVNAGFMLPAVVHTTAKFVYADSSGTTNQRRSAAAVGDGELFIKVKLYQTTKSTVAFTGKLILPSGVNDNTYELNSGYGTLGEAASVEYIYKHNEKLYAQAYGGFLHRGNDFTDDVIAGGDAGYRLLPQLWTVLTCRAVNPLENGNDFKTGGLYGLGRNNSGYIRLGLEVDLSLNKRFDLFAHTSYPVKGQFVQASPVFEAGIGIFFEGKEEAGN
jgi:hypothetical protein